MAFASTMQAQTYLPQIADGGNWYTAVLLLNTTASPAAASVTFFQDTANGATAPWNPPFVEVNSTQNLTIPAGATIYMHTAGTAATLTQGWGQVTGSGVTAYAIYTYEAFAGRPNQDGTSQAVAGATRILVPFDATTGYSTGLAVVNPTDSAENVSVNFELDSGAISQSSLPAIPPDGQLAVSIATQFPATAGHRGTAEFYVSSGSISIAAFRFNPTLALTSLPVVLASGPPIISGVGGGGGSSLPQFTFIQLTGLSFTSSSGAAGGSGGGGGGEIIASTSGTGYALANISVNQFSTGSTPSLTVGCNFLNISVNGSTFSITGPKSPDCTMTMFTSTLTASTFALSAGSMTLTFTPNGTPSVGSVSGTVNFTSPLGTLSGTVSGSYFAQ